MYSLVVLLSMLATSLYLRAYTGDERAGAALARAVRARARGHALHPQLGALPRRRRCSSPGSGCSRWRPRPSAGARLRDGALGFGLAALLYLPWVPTLLFQAAHTGAPWSRKPGYEDLTMEATHRLLGHTAWLVLVVAAGGGVVALVRAGRGRRLTAEGRAVLAVGIVARRRPCCSPTAPRSSRRRGRCATSRSPSRRSCCCAPPGSPPRAASGSSASSIVSILWAYDVWPTDARATCARSRRRSRPASARATSSSRPSPSRCRCSTTTCRRGCATRR